MIYAYNVLSGGLFLLTGACQPNPDKCWKSRNFSDEIRKRPVFYPTDLVIDSSASYTAGCAKHLLSVYDAFISLSFCLRDSQTLPSAYTFGTLYGILQRAIQIQSCSFWEPLRVLLLRWANCRFPAPFFWHNMQLTNFIIALFSLLSILL